MAYLEWPRKIADSLSRILGIVMILESIGIFAFYCCELDIWVASFLFFAGMESVMLPETKFWKSQFKKPGFKKPGFKKKRKRK